MDKKNISPNPQQPVDRVPTGQLPSALAELSEKPVSPSYSCYGCCACSYDGDEE